MRVRVVFTIVLTAILAASVSACDSGSKSSGTTVLLSTLPSVAPGSGVTPAAMAM